MTTIRFGMITLWVWVFSASLLAPEPAAAARDPELNIRSEVRDIQREFRVRVHYRYDEQRYFPPGSRLEKVAASATELTDDELRRVLPIVRIFLSSYPKSMLRRHLQDVFVMKDLQMGGGLWGGTYYDRGIYVNCAMSDRSILSTMFHEISSMLMHKYPFPERKWLQANGPGSKYIGAHHFANGRNNGSASTYSGLENGFITNYARSNIENDFNEMSEWLFTRYYTLRRLAKEYPRIAEKMQLAIDFYLRVDDDFEFTDKAKL